jgi:signal transduction histidine kinase
LRVRDDGRGFDPAAGPEGYGLAGMKARAQRIGASMVVDTAPGTGTAIEVDVPTGAG